MAFALAVVAARLLGPSGAGVLQLSQALGNQLALVLSLGASISVVRAAALDPQDPRPFTSSVLLLLALLPVFAFVVPAAAGLARVVIDDAPDERLALVLAVPLGWLFIAQDMTVAVFRGRNRYVTVAAVTFGARLAVAVAVVTAIVAVDDDARTALVAMVAVNAVVTAGVFALGVRAFGVHIEGAVRTLGRLVRFNLAGHVGTILQEASYRLDLFLVAGMLSTGAAGIYGVAGVLCTLLWYVPNAVGAVLLSRIPSAAPEAQSERLVAAVRVSLAVMLAMGGVAALGAPFAVPALFGARFSGAVVPFLILLPGAVLLSVWKVVANGMAALGYPAMKLPSAATGAVVGVVLDLWLIPRHGIRGAAAAAAAAYAVTTVLLLRPACRVLAVDARSLFAPDFPGAVRHLAAVTTRGRHGVSA